MKTGICRCKKMYKRAAFIKSILGFYDLGPPIYLNHPRTVQQLRALHTIVGGILILKIEGAGNVYVPDNIKLSRIIRLVR